MSARAPISGDQSLRDHFSKADSDPEFGYLHIVINFDTNKFEVNNYASNKDLDDDALFEQMVTECAEKEHTFFIVRDPTHNNVIKPKRDELKEDNDEASNSKSQLNLYILIHFAPDLSPVKQRMMYASSRPSLKAFLGHSAFSQDYHCSSTPELSIKKIIDARTLHQRIDFRSDAEIEKEQASLDSVATAAKSSVMKSLPIDIQESAVSAIDNYKSGACKCVFLSLTKGTQGIEGEEKKVDKLSELRDLLSDNDPKYILFWYSKSKAENVEEEKEQFGAKQIFGYYCPEKADRKFRFVYSTCKANVIEYCASIGVEFYAKVECTNSNEFKEDYMDYHVFPVKEKKQTFAMPKGPKSRRKSRSKKKKKINLDDLE